MLITELKPMHLISFIAAIIFVAICGMFAGRKVKNADEYQGGSFNKGFFSCFGILVGVAMGGAGTIGSAQLGFSYGLAGLWFTLGQGLANVLLAVVLTVPLRSSGKFTVSQMIGAKYSKRVSVISGIIAAGCLLPSIVSQFSSSSILINFCTDLPLGIAACLAMILMVVFVIVGGADSTSTIGEIKAVVLGGGMFICGLSVLIKSDFGRLLIDTLPAEPYFNMFSRGSGRDLCNALGVGIGLLAVQANQMAIISAKDVKAAKGSLFACAAFLPMIGICSCTVGMFMRCKFPDIEAAKCLILYIVNFLPKWLGGVILAVLLVAMLATASGCALSIVTVIYRDIFSKWLTRETISETKQLVINRVLVFVILCSCYVMYVAKPSVTILDWSFVSSALRSAFIFAPLLTTIYLKDSYIKEKFMIAGMIIGPVTVLLAYSFSDLGWMPLVSGLVMNTIVVLLGMRKKELAKGGI